MAQDETPRTGSNGPQAGEAPPRLGEFEILERIGQGAVGAVFKARQLSMDRLVAVKVLKPRLAADPGYVERFWREARAAARLTHPNIVLAIDAGEAHGYYYFAMEYVEGHPVSLLRKAAVFEERRALEIVRQVAQALDYAWTAERIVHRDIKPGNIIITPDGTAKLADLGLAQEVLEPDADDAESAAVFGTPLYLSPEQIRREPDLDVRCDLYALGATLFHMVTGRPPYRGPDAKTIIRKHLHRRVPDARDYRPELSDGIAYVLRKLLAKDRDDRYPDARALISDIDVVMETGRVPGRPAHPVRIARRRRRGVSVSGVVALCIVLGGLLGAAITIWGLHRRAQGPHAPESDRAGRPTSAVEPPSPAQQAYDRAVAFYNAHPDDYVRAVALFRAVEAGHPDSTYARLAAPQRERLETVLDEKAEDTLKSLTQRARALLSAGRFAEALGVFDRFPSGLATEEWRGRVADARRAVEHKARRRFEAALAPGDQAAEAGRLDEALALYQAVPAPALAEWRDEISERVAAVERRLAQRAARAEAQAEAEADAAYARLIKQVAAHYRKREYDAAEALLAANLDDAERHRDGMERELAEIEHLRSFWSAVEAGARKAIGKPYAVRGIPGHISAVAEGRLTIRTASRPFSEELVKLPRRDALRFALAALDGQRGGVAAARFLIAEGQATEAEQRLAKLATDGADVSAQRARLALLCSDRLRADARADLEEARGAEEPAAALEAFLDRYQGQAAVADLCAEARRLREAAQRPKPAGPTETEALSAQLRFACDGACDFFVNGEGVATGEVPQGELATCDVRVRDGDVLACEAVSRGGHPGFYAVLSVGEGRHVVVTDASWRVATEPPEGWRTARKPSGEWRAARLAYSPHARPGYGEALRGEPGYWIWGAGERCCFHRVLRLTRTTAQEAERRRHRDAQLTKEHGPPVPASLRLDCGGAYAVTLNGDPVGCAARAVPPATYALRVREGDVLGVRAQRPERGGQGWLEAQLDVEGVDGPLHSDRSWVWTSAPAPEGWDRRGSPEGVWRAAEFLDSSSHRVWGRGNVVHFRKRIHLARLRDQPSEAARRLHGRLADRSRWRTEVVYDLSDPEQLADWFCAGDLAWTQGRLSGTARPVLSAPVATQDVQVDIQLQAPVDLLLGLWGETARPGRGYTLRVSDSRRPEILLRRRARTLWMERVTTASPRRRQVSFRRYGKLFTVSVDGRRVFSARDKEPLDAEETRRVGFIAPSGERGVVTAIRLLGRFDWEGLATRRGARPPEGMDDRDGE
ncbi:MAG: protein kinase domain-containing protein [bacterium]